MATCNVCGKDAGYLSSLCDACRAARPPVDASVSVSQRAEAPHVEASDRDNGNFLARLANGDFGLPRTYWLFGVLPGVVVNLVTRTITSVGVLAGVVLLYAAYEVVVLIGTWRASNDYRGPKVWSVLAKVAVLLGALLLAISVLAAVSLLTRA